MHLKNKVYNNHKFTKKIICYKCGTEGHKSNVCTSNKSGGFTNTLNKWCKGCKSSTHTTENCRKLLKIKKMQDENVTSTHNANGDSSNNSFVFMVNQDNVNGVKNDHSDSFLVDCGATSHIVTNDACFINIDQNFNPNEHYIELADGSKSNNIALKRGEVRIFLQDNKGNLNNIILQNVLYIPSYPQNIFSVQSATARGAIIHFQPNSAELIANNSIFNITEKGKIIFFGHRYNSC